MITIGIDPGFARLGVAVIESKNNTHKLLYSALIETFPTMDYHERLHTIHLELLKVIDKYKPNRAAIETLFFSKNTKTALQVAEARGVIILTLALSSIKIKEYKPKEIKSRITGYGNANKEAVIKMISILLGVKEHQDDTADAIAIALTLASENKISLL